MIKNNCHKYSVSVMCIVLSKKGCPYDNAVSEATFKILKTEFVRNQRFRNFNELQYELSDYVNWFNHHRIHSSLGYQTPIQYKYNTLKNIVGLELLRRGYKVCFGRVGEREIDFTGEKDGDKLSIRACS